MQIDLSITQAIIEALKQNVGATGPQVDAIIGDVVNKRKTQGMYGAAYYQDNNDVVYMPVQVNVGKGPRPGTSSTQADWLGVKDGNGTATGVWWLPYPLMGVTEIQPHIIDTELTERNGMVSELINTNGFKVHITGYLVNTVANEFPEGDYNTLVRLGNINAPVVVSSVRTDILMNGCGNTAKTMTIRNVSINKKAGCKHVAEYSLELWCDMPFNLVEVS